MAGYVYVYAARPKNGKTFTALLLPLLIKALLRFFVDIL